MTLTMSVSQWLLEMGYNPWHGMQLANSTLLPVTSSCNTVLFDRAPMNADRVGRAEIARALSIAAQQIHTYTRRWPTPRYQETTLAWPRLADNRLVRLNPTDPEGRWLNLQLPNADLIALGAQVESDSMVVTLTYSDEDGDGLDETATATAVVDAGTTADDIVVRFRAADCGPQAPPEILPRSVSVDTNNVATIICNSWDLVRPVRTVGWVQAALDPTVVPPTAGSPLAATVEVLRRRSDPTGTSQATAQAVLIWETAPWPAWATCCAEGSSSDPSALAYALARLTIRDAAVGIVAGGEAVYDTTTGTWHAVSPWESSNRCRPPDRITVRYTAGLSRSGTQVADPWRTVLARLAAANLARPLCACEAANKELNEWQFDLSYTGKGDTLYAAPADMANPLGTRRGHIYAWRYLRYHEAMIGILAG